MKKLLFTITLFATSLAVFSQKVEDIIAAFECQECSVSEYLDDKDWQYARYVFSQIDPPFYDMNKAEQLKDTVNGIWFDKVFTRKEGESYSLDFEKVKKEAALVNIADIPEVNEFIFIGMKIPLLEKTRSIKHLSIEDCSKEVKDRFRTEAKKIIGSYEILANVRDNESETFVMKNKDSDSFHELVILELGEDLNLVKMEGIFDISDLSAPKDYNE